MSLLFLISVSEFWSAPSYKMWYTFFTILGISYFTTQILEYFTQFNSIDMLKYEFISMILVLKS